MIVVPLDAAASEQSQPLPFELRGLSFRDINDKIQDCIHSSDIISIDLMLSKWKDPKASNLLVPEARNYLHACTYVAMEAGKFPLAQYLLDMGIPVDFRCSSPAIAHALDTNSTLILEMLLEHGWETEQVFNPFRTGDEVIKSLYHNEGLVLWLLSQGASPSAASDWGDVPIERAAQYAPLSMLKLLVARGARVQSTDAVVKAAIGDAMGESGRLEVVKYLAGLGAPINAHDMQFCDYDKCVSMILLKGKMTALHHAAKAGKRGMTALLLELGADKSLRNFAEKTALDLAVEHGHEGIVYMLQS